MNAVQPAIDVTALGKVAVLMGGHSAEREISLMSGQGVLEALRSRGVDAHAFDPAHEPLCNLAEQGFARCFIALHGRYGEDGTVQGALELLRIPYTGSGVLASSIGIDKVTTKRVWLAEGLATPRHVALHRDHLTPAQIDRVAVDLGLPLVVKPVREGSSLGVTVVRAADDLHAAVARAAERDADVLCEQFIAGDEVTCAVVGTGAGARALPVIHIVVHGGEYDYENKYFTSAAEYRVPADLPAAELDAVQALSLAAYRVLGCRGWGRVDIMIDGVTRQPWLLEVNTSPGMTGHSLVPSAAAAAGMAYEDLCLQLLADAALDYASKDSTP